MTATECWSVIERCCKEGDRTGLLVCADALQELGEEEMAKTVRWAVKLDRLPEFRPVAQQKWYYQFPVCQVHLYSDYEYDVAFLWKQIAQWRTTMLEFFT